MRQSELGTVNVPYATTDERHPDLFTAHGPRLEKSKTVGGSSEHGGHFLEVTHAAFEGDMLQSTCGRRDLSGIPRSVGVAGEIQLKTRKSRPEHESQ